ncbi:uncharacterized protein LOC125710210 isoform X2 [Brienomyrus brachyistius]|uniref:uncharacterized protein LOC125710210 isoform X2 n=1 Tax=Brienomyrus brachyistius TaxID=42636 RepID=UPI0020B27F5B|nr:uncharacterized protein LOC125710210 isoform X2 [Brienomyrus brachyistius]
MWTFISILIIPVTFCHLTKGESQKALRCTSEKASTDSATQDAFTEYRSEYFDLNSSVTLNCSNKTWASILFITWMIDIDGKQCQMAHSDNDSKHDTCNDGKILRNNANGETYLYIPHFTKRDEGRYQCETVYNGGSSKVVINVSAKVPQQIMSHPSWTENYTDTLQLPSRRNFNVWQWIIIYLTLICFLMGIFVGLYVLRNHLSKIRNCCKFGTSAAPPLRQPQKRW